MGRFRNCEICVLETMKVKESQQSRLLLIHSSNPTVIVDSDEKNVLQVEEDEQDEQDVSMMTRSSPTDVGGVCVLEFDGFYDVNQALPSSYSSDEEKDREDPATTVNLSHHEQSTASEQQKLRRQVQWNSIVEIRKYNVIVDDSSSASDGRLPSITLDWDYYSKDSASIENSRERTSTYIPPKKWTYFERKRIALSSKTASDTDVVEIGAALKSLQESLNSATVELLPDVLGAEEEDKLPDIDHLLGDDDNEFMLPELDFELPDLPGGDEMMDHSITNDDDDDVPDIFWERMDEMMDHNIPNDDDDDVPVIFWERIVNKKSPLKNRAASEEEEECKLPEDVDHLLRDDDELPELEIKLPALPNGDEMIYRMLSDDDDVPVIFWERINVNKCPLNRAA